MTELEKMLNGQMYDAEDSQLSTMRSYCRDQLQLINFTYKIKDSKSIVNNLINSKDGNASIQPPFYCDYGVNIYVGVNFYANFNNVFLDVCPITIGDNCMFGPDVKLYTATHPLDPTERNSGLEYAKPITIGDNVWIGGNSTVVPGVNVGNNVVIAAGSVVTKDVPDNVVFGGNPGKILKQIGV